MIKTKTISVLFPVAIIVLLVALAYGNIVFLGRSLNPVLLIPPDDIKLSTGYADIIGTDSATHGWQVDLANPAYLEWPVNIFIGRSLKGGHIPLVLPDQNLGVPLIGQYCHRVLSPYQIVENLFFPRGYNFFLLLRLALAGIFTYLFVRPLCRRKESALLAAVGFGLGSTMVIYSNHEEVSNVAMMLPLLMWATRALFDRPGIGRGCWLALALAMVHTAGQPEIQLYVLFLTFLYGCVRLLSRPAGDRMRPLAYSLAAMILSGIIAAPQIYLFLRFHSEAWTFHPPGGNLGLQSPMERANFLFAFFPKLRQTPWVWSYRTINLLWDWVGGYFGLGLLFLAAAATGRPRRNRREIALFGCYFLFILAKNLGWSPAQMIGILPFFDQTWTPRWAAATWSFALAVLAGLGLDNILDGPPPAAAAAMPTPVVKTGKLSILLANPVFPSALLFIDIILISVCWRQGIIHWRAEHLRGFVLCNGLLFLLLAAGTFLLWHLLPPPIRSSLRDSVGMIRRAFRERQLPMIALLSALAAAALRMIPLKQYFSLSGSSPLENLYLSPSAATVSYLFAAPLFLAALSGLFLMAASPSRPWSVVFSAVAIPSVIVSGWVQLPPEPLPLIFGGIFILAVAALSVFKARPRILRVILPSLSFPLFFGLAAFVLATPPVSDPRFNWLIRLHGYYAMIALAIFSGLRLWVRRGGTGCGWFFLLLVWSELIVYIPKNHSDRYLLIDGIPFLIAALTVLGFAVHFRRHTLSGKKLTICILTIIIICGATLLIIDRYAPGQLPASCTPDEPLPYVKYLQDKKRGSIVGFGRVLTPNFASAHNLLDVRGCVSMNTTAYQFFIENILQAVPRGTSYSLWFTGDNSPQGGGGTPYASSMRNQIAAFRRAFPFYLLASVRHVICPPGALDSLGDEYSKFMRKVYAKEVDIWEIPARPLAYIAHKADVISMLSNPRLWATTIVNSQDIIRGERVLLEETPSSILPESDPSSSDSALLLFGEDPNRFRIRFYAERPGYIVVTRVYTNLLRAYINGEEIPVLQANGPFIALPVSGSDQERVVELTYLSPPAKTSFEIGFLGLLSVMGLLLFSALKRK